MHNTLYYNKYLNYKRKYLELQKAGNPKDIISKLPNDAQSQVLKFLNLADVTKLSGTSPDNLQVTQNYRNCDLYSVDIDLQIWRKKFPNVPCITITNRDDLTDADFQYLRGIKKMFISACTQITDNAFKYLDSLKILIITNSDFTDDAFQYLTELEELCIFNCMNLTDNIFMFLPNLKKISLLGLTNITDNAFQYLTKLDDLTISECNRLTNNAFVHLTNLKRLSFANCENITNVAFHNLTNLEELEIILCEQFSDNAFKHLNNLKKLNIRKCREPGPFPIGNDNITDAAFLNLTNLEELKINRCSQITANVFDNLKKLKKLHIEDCLYESISFKNYRY